MEPQGSRHEGKRSEQGWGERNTMEGVRARAAALSQARLMAAPRREALRNPGTQALQCPVGVKAGKGNVLSGSLPFRIPQ